MKKFLGCIVVILLLGVFASGCAGGVSQGEYDKVKSDLSAAQSQIQVLQGEIESLEGKFAEVKPRLEVLLEVVTMSEEVSESEIMVLNSKIEALSDQELMTRWQTQGKLWEKVMQGQASEEEAIAAWMSLVEYLISTISDALQ